MKEMNEYILVLGYSTQHFKLLLHIRCDSLSKDNSLETKSFYF